MDITIEHLNNKDDILTIKQLLDYINSNIESGNLSEDDVVLLLDKDYNTLNFKNLRIIHNNSTIDCSSHKYKDLIFTHDNVQCIQLLNCDGWKHDNNISIKHKWEK